MIRLLTCALAFLAATEASALSCTRPDPVSDYIYAFEGEEDHLALWGEFEFRPSSQPSLNKEDPNDASPAPPVVATFTGRVLGNERFSRNLTTEVVLEPTCFGPWCGGFPPPGKWLAFVNTEGDSNRLVLSPCPGMVYPDASWAMIRAVEACHKGVDCRPFNQ